MPKCVARRGAVRITRYLSLIMIGVVSTAVPGVFLISITPLSLLFLLFLTMFLPGFVSFSLAGLIALPDHSRSPIAFLIPVRCMDRSYG